MSSKRLSLECSFEPQLKRLFHDQSDEFKKSIYDKTMRKLYDGAKRNVFPKPMLDVIIPGQNSSLHSEIRRGLKQISLDNNCRLECASKITNPKVYSPLLPDKCSFCERLGCFTVLNQCLQCKEYFCYNCSFLKNCGPEEVYVCISCY